MRTYQVQAVEARAGLAERVGRKEIELPMMRCPPADSYGEQGTVDDRGGG